MASQNAAGSASEEYAKYLDSIEGKTAQLKATWESFATNFLNSDFIKGGTDALRTLLGLLNQITAKLGGGATAVILGGSAVVGFSLLKGFKNNGVVNTFKNISAKIPNIIKKVSSLGSTSASAAGEVSVLASSFATLGTVLGVAAAAGAVFIAAGIGVDKLIQNERKRISELPTAIKAASDSYANLLDVQKEISELELVINNSESSQAEIDAAKSRLQEIATMLNEKYNLQISADLTDLETAVKFLSEAERLNALNAASDYTSSFSEGTAWVQDISSSYQKSASYYSGNVDSVSELQSLKTKYSEIQASLKLVQQNANSTGVVSSEYANKLYKELKSVNEEASALGYNFGDDDKFGGINGSVDTLQELNILMRAVNGDVEKTTSLYNETNTELQKARENMAQIKSEISGIASGLASTLVSDVLSGASASAIKEDTLAFTNLGMAMKEAGIATNDLAVQYAYAKEGCSSFSEAVSKELTGSMANSVIEIQQTFGESLRTSVRTAALVLTGFSDASELTALSSEDLSAKTKELYKNMAELGKSKGVSDFAQNALEGTAMLAAGFDSVNEVMLAGESGIESFIQKYYELKKSTDEGFKNLNLANQQSELTNIARSLGLIGEEQVIQIDASGAISVCNSVIEKLNDIYNYGERKFRLSISSDFEGEDRPDTILQAADSLDGKMISIYTKADGTAEVQLDGVYQKVKQVDQEKGTVTIEYNGCDVEIDALNQKVLSITGKPLELEFGASDSFDDIYNKFSGLKAENGDIHFAISADGDGVDVLNSANETIANLKNNGNYTFTFNAEDNTVEIINKITGQTYNVPVDFFVGSQEEPITEWYGFESVEAQITKEPVKKFDGVEDVRASIINSIQTHWDGTLAVHATLASVSSSLSNLIANMYTGSASTRGMSYAGGTAISGMSYASGDWGIPYDQTALVGEIGQELIVRGNKFFTVGDKSAEMVHLRKGDIIFNADQTRDIIKHGKIISGSRRGKTYGDSYASGSALLSGNAYVSATAPDGTTRMDYIERLFEKMENSIDRIRTKAESAYKSLETRTKASYGLIDELKSAANTYKQGADTYLNYANSIEGHPVAINQGKNGQMFIWDAATEHGDQTKAAAEWMGKYEDSLQKYLDTLEDIAEAYQDMFDMIEENYENELKMVEALSDSYDNLLDKIETSGYLVDSKVYANLIEAKTDEITVLRKELSELETSFKEAMDSGYIEEYSEAWYEMKESINDTSNAIEECEVDLIKLRKEMRDAEWDYFDYIDDRISALQTESEFMIDLMEKYDLYDKNGNITEYGQATLGLHGQNYNTLMNQADSYAKEIKSLNKQIAQDPNNTELIDRRQDLLELQQKAILAAEDEKQAIRDLVEEGINTELDALDDLIDKYTETIDTAKDLYDYQKQVKEQTEEIAKLQKQLTAYSGDTSQEARAKIQTIKVDLAKAQEELAETQYDQYISDQKKLLENLRDEYELLLNERLDDVDALISDVIDSVNASSVDICNTLNDVSDEIGYTMTDSMQKVWDGSTLAINGVITKYGDNFDTKLTAVNATLSAIRTSVDKVAGVNQTTSTSGSTSSSSSSSSSSSVSARTTTAAVSATPAAKTITVGGLINAGSAPIYQWAGGEGYSQYFSSDPIYTVLQESNGFVQVRWHNLSSGITGWFRKSDVTAYKKGGLVDYTGLAWLDGSPSNPEYILNAKDTKALMGSGTAPRYSISGGLSIADLIAKLDSSAVNIGNSIGDIIMNVAVDHVEDYEDFVTKLQQDDQFEKLIRSMTIDRLAGKSSLAKNKFKW